MLLKDIHYYEYFAGPTNIGVEAVEDEEEAVEVEAAAMNAFSLEINASFLLAL